MEKTPAEQLADDTLRACKGDFKQAIAELKYQLDPTGSAVNETILDAIDDLKRLRAYGYNK